MNSDDVIFQPLTVSVSTTPLDLSIIQKGNYVPLKVVMSRLNEQPKSVTTTPVDCGIIQQGDSKTITVQIGNPNIQPVLSRQNKLGTKWVILDNNDTRILLPNEQQEIQVIVDTSTLVAGSYTATLTFTADAKDGDISACVHVPLLLKVSSVSDPDNKVQPILAGSLLKTGLSFAQFLSSSQTLPLIIHNWDAQNAVKWRADTGGEFWLTLDRSEGILQPSEQQTIWVTANSTSLQFGDYTATLTIITDDTQQPTQFQVELAVAAIRDGDNGPKAPIPNPDHFDFSNLQSAVTYQTLQITNPPDQNPPNVILTIDNSVPTPLWLTWNVDQQAIPLQAGGNRKVNLIINKNGLGPGHYTFDLKPTFQFAPPAPVGSHKTSTPVTVTLTIP